ncbi:uncharacterized protein RAG0_04699 [Rhynchosporium agropyri]|uniref:Uncharacterized protein n=2 Tax=Rhynchosporium TaxID=38037 RepID=A0A1E1M2F4_RHYSE|nr:uncharacterized protein RAG0_04699 [Rhynchosporium agropyri]CZT43277.1 uncharacterized protein RSE6_03286 [Rhynchosporium secalis]
MIAASPSSIKTVFYSWDADDCGVGKCRQLIAAKAMLTLFEMQLMSRKILSKEEGDEGRSIK